MADATEIRALVLDVDGVLTDGRVMVTDAGQEMKCLRYQARREGLVVALVTGEEIPMVAVSAQSRRTVGEAF